MAIAGLVASMIASSASYNIEATVSKQHDQHRHEPLHNPAWGDSVRGYRRQPDRIIHRS